MQQKLLIAAKMAEIATGLSMSYEFYERSEENSSRAIQGEGMPYSVLELIKRPKDQFFPPVNKGGRPLPSQIISPCEISLSVI